MNIEPIFIYHAYWKIAESTVCRIVRKVENILIQSRKFSLPGKKKLLDSALDEKLVLMDVMESPIERPTQHQKRFYSGKQGEHTLKMSAKHTKDFRDSISSSSLCRNSFDSNSSNASQTVQSFQLGESRK